MAKTTTENTTPIWENLTGRELVLFALDASSRHLRGLNVDGKAREGGWTATATNSAELERIYAKVRKELLKDVVPAVEVEEPVLAEPVAA